MGSVTFDAQNGELRNDLSFFRPFASRPDDIRWRVKEGDAVNEGDELGRFVWPDEPAHAEIVAPPGCSGTVRSIHRGVVCRFLGRGPSQVLLQIDVAQPPARTGPTASLSAAARHAGIHHAIAEAAAQAGASEADPPASTDDDPYVDDP